MFSRGTLFYLTGRLRLVYTLYALKEAGRLTIPWRCCAANFGRWNLTTDAPPSAFIGLLYQQVENDESTKFAVRCSHLAVHASQNHAHNYGYNNETIVLDMRFPTVLRTTPTLLDDLVVASGNSPNPGASIAKRSKSLDHFQLLECSQPLRSIHRLFRDTC